MNTMALPAPRLASFEDETHAREDLVVDLERSEVRHRDGRCYELSGRETDLLICLAHKIGTPVSRAEILTRVWKLDPQRTVTRTIDMHISVLRKKLGDVARTPAVLLTIHGVGYMLRGGSYDAHGTLQFENKRDSNRDEDELAWVKG